MKKSKKEKKRSKSKHRPVEKDAERVTAVEREDDEKKPEDLDKYYGVTVPPQTDIEEG